VILLWAKHFAISDEFKIQVRRSTQLEANFEVAGLCYFRRRFSHNLPSADAGSRKVAGSGMPEVGGPSDPMVNPLQYSPLVTKK